MKRTTSRQQAFRIATKNRRLTLPELRRRFGKTQQDMATLTGMSQSDISKFERRTDHLASRLRRYIEVLGGKIEFAVVLGDGTRCSVFSGNPLGLVRDLS